MNRITCLSISEVRDCWPACALFFLWVVPSPDLVGCDQGKEVGWVRGWDPKVQHVLLGGRGTPELTYTYTSKPVSLSIPTPIPTAASMHSFPPFLGPPVEGVALSHHAKSHIVGLLAYSHLSSIPPPPFRDNHFNIFTVNITVCSTELKSPTSWSRIPDLILISCVTWSFSLHNVF